MNLSKSIINDNEKFSNIPYEILNFWLSKIEIDQELDMYTMDDMTYFYFIIKPELRLHNKVYAPTIVGRFSYNQVEVYLESYPDFLGTWYKAENFIQRLQLKAFW